MMRSHLPSRSLLLAALLVVAIAVNAIQFQAIDAAEGSSVDALHRGTTADLSRLAYEECDWCQDRYSLHLALRVVAPGSRVVVAPSDPFTLQSPYEEGADAAEEITVRLLTFGGGERVDWLAGDDWAQDEAAPHLVAGVDPTPFIIARGEGGLKGAPWALAVDPARLGTEQSPDPDRFLARALARGAHLRPSAPPGEFVLVRWYVPRCHASSSAVPCYSYQDLLLEMSLLPAPVREEL